MSNSFRSRKQRKSLIATKLHGNLKGHLLSDMVVHSDDVTSGYMTSWALKVRKILFALESRGRL